MMSTVIGAFPNAGSAEAAFRELVAARVSPDQMSVMSRHELAQGEVVDAERREPGGSSAAAGMATGAALGGLGGLLVGLGVLTIPGIGPVLAAGPIAAALAGAGLGAVGGALVGALIDLGVPDDEAQELAEAVRRGAILLAARVDDDQIDRAVEIMERHGAIDVAEQVSRWRGAGWSRFDERAAPYAADELTREREALGIGGSPGHRRVRIYGAGDRRRVA